MSREIYFKLCGDLGREPTDDEMADEAARLQDRAYETWKQRNCLRDGE